MEEKDLIELLFEKKDMDGKLNFKSKELEKQDKKLSILDNEITKFIDKKVHPKCRRKLHELIDDYARATFQYYDKERGLIYETGFFDGIKVMIDSLYNKWQMLYIIYRA